MRSASYVTVDSAVGQLLTAIATARQLPDLLLASFVENHFHLDTDMLIFGNDLQQTALCQCHVIARG